MMILMNQKGKTKYDATRCQRCSDFVVNQEYFFSTETFLLVFFSIAFGFLSFFVVLFFCNLTKYIIYSLHYLF